MFKNKTLVKQDGFKDCGPACLLMIIKHYKGYLDIEELKLMCKNDNKGTTAYHLIEAAKICGFEASGVRCELKDINASNIILPCIAHITIDNSYNHYVVIDKIDFKKKRLLIKDPIGKISYYTYDEFNKIFNNILITLYPIKPIPLMQKNSYGIFIKNILSSSKKELLQVIIISIFITIFSIITTFYLQNMIDNVNTTKNKIYFIFIIFLILYIFKIVSDFLRNQIIILINQKVDLELTDKTFKQMILLPYYYYRNHTTGEIISRISDLEAVRQVISKVAISIFIDLPLTIIALIVMYIMNTTLFIISIVIMLLYLLIGLIFKQPFNNYVDSCQRKKASATSYMVESINGFESVKGCNIEKSIINNFENKYVDMSNEIFKFDHCYNYQYLLKEIINNIGFIAIILVGILLVFDNKITLGNLLSFNALLAYFLEPIRNIMDLDTSVKQALNAIKRVLKMFYVKSNTSIINKPMQGDIIIKDLTYSFDDVHNV
ncbi:MAG: ABC transporter transmembrane domain-containing protein, partial [Bacilli bacterium]